MSNKMQRYAIYLYLETALHVSSVTYTHHEERIQQYLQHLVFVNPLLLPAAIAAHRSSSGALTVFAASGLHTHVMTGRSQV
jgi:hypothetical protein